MKRHGPIAFVLALAVGGIAFAQVESRTPQPEGGEDKENAWIGIILGDAVDGGVHVIAVVPGSPAERSDLRAGDVVVGAGGRPLVGARGLRELLDSVRPGARLELDLFRSGESVRRIVEVAERPSSTAFTRAVVPVAPLPPLPPDPPAKIRFGCAAYGLLLTDLSPDLQRHFGAPDGTGVLVNGVIPGRLAESDGFQVGDVLIRIGERPVFGVEDVERWLRAPRDEAVATSLLRGREAVVVRMTRTRPGGPAADQLERAVESATRAVAERAVHLEIERLRARIERVKQETEALDKGPER